MALSIACYNITSLEAELENSRMAGVHHFPVPLELRALSATRVSREKELEQMHFSERNQGKT